MIGKHKLTVVHAKPITFALGRTLKDEVNACRIKMMAQCFDHQDMAKTWTYLAPLLVTSAIMKCMPILKWIISAFV